MKKITKVNRRISTNVGYKMTKKELTNNVLTNEANIEHLQEKIDEIIETINKIKEK